VVKEELVLFLIPVGLLY